VHFACFSIAGDFREKGEPVRGQEASRERTETMRAEIFEGENGEAIREVAFGNGAVLRGNWEGEWGASGKADR